MQTQLLSNESHNTRSTNSIREIYARTKLYYDSFLPNTIRLWNTIPSNVQNNHSIRSFKKYLNKNNITIPEYYHIGSRIGQILHSQLRLECSTLNLYLFNKPLSILFLFVWISRKHWSLPFALSKICYNTKYNNKPTRKFYRP